MKIESLKNLAEYNAVQSKKLFNAEKFHSMLISIENGKEMKAHHSATDVMGYLIAGKIELSIEENEFSLSEGDAFFIPAKAVHSLRGITDSSFILIR